MSAESLVLSTMLNRKSLQVSPRAEQLAQEFLDRHQAPGLSVALSHNGQVIYDRAFGLANRVRQEKLTPQHRFRIASISKTITAACIFRFIDLGKLSLHQPIFGEDEVLKFDYARTYSAATKALTIYHLLTHTGGG